MKKNKNYTIDDHGNLNFDTLKKVEQKENEENTIWQKQIVYLFLLILCFLADLISFTQLFSSFLYDSLFIRLVGITGFLIVFEGCSLYGGMYWKYKRQGYTVENMILLMLVSTFTLAVALNIILRIVTANIAFPDLTNNVTSVIGNNVTTQSTSSSNSIYYALLFAFIPVMSSCISFAVCCLITDPLKNEKRKYAQNKNMLKSDINAKTATLEEYSNEDAFKKNTMRMDSIEYHDQWQKILDQRKYYCDYVRAKLKEHLGGADENSSVTRNKPKDLILPDFLQKNKEEES